MIILLCLLLAAEPAAKDSELLYALGAILGQRLQPYHLKPAELERVRKGFLDSASGAKLKLDDDDLEEWGPRVDAYMARRMTPQIAAEKDRGQAFLDKAAREPGATRTPSGLVLRVLAPGGGTTPGAGDKVRVSYQGRLADGTVFDDSARHGGPMEVALGSVIHCWSEGLQLMKVGGKARLHCPSTLGYGDQGRPPQVAGGAALVFDVELIEIIKK
jgi:FKBP-type peptidyl-prolyl cis-trans isomerase FkpA